MLHQKSLQIPYGLLHSDSLEIIQNLWNTCAGDFRCGINEWERKIKGSDVVNMPELDRLLQVSDIGILAVN